MLVASTTGYQVRAFSDAARKLDIELVLATDRCHILEDPWADRAVPVRFDNPMEAANTLKAWSFDGIVAVGDKPACLAATLAERLDIPFHEADAVQAASDKAIARARFEAAGMLVPEYYQVPRDNPDRAARFYPCVLKPLGLSASRGVIRADTDEQFTAAARRIRQILERLDGNPLRSRFIQVERYLDGPEFALEGLVTCGQLETLAIFDKPDPLTGPYFEETIYVTPSRQSAAVQARLREAAQQAVTALGLTQGPIHAELRLTGRGVFVLEVAARPIGGLCSRALRLSSGRTLEELILLHSLMEFSQLMGEDLMGEGRMGEGMAGKVLPGGVMMIPIPKSGIYESMSGLEEALAVPGVSDIAITAKPGQMLETLPEGSSYLGFIFAEGPLAEESLREAHRMLTFTIQTALPIAGNG